MRVIWKQCREILDVRILLILALFTLLFFQLFLQILYPKNGKILGGWANYPYSIELMKEFGKTIQVSDWSKLEAKEEELKREYSEFISASEKCRAAGITTYDEMMEYEDKYINTDIETDGEMPEEERALHDEITDIMYEQWELTCKLEYLEDLNMRKGSEFGMSKEEIEQEMSDWDINSAWVKKEYEERFSRNYTSFMLMHVFNILWEDMPKMGILLSVSFFVLILYYQIRERLRGTIYLCATTRTGRKVFGRQFAACMLSCAVVGIMQMIAYFTFFLKKGLGPLLACPCEPFNGPYLWCDQISYGLFFLIYAVFVFLFTLMSAGIAYLIGRVAANYIVGIAISIPVMLGIALLAFRLFGEFLQVDTAIGLPYWELPCVVVCVGIMAAVVVWRLRRDKKIDFA